MASERYDIVLHSPMGPKKGWMAIFQEPGSCNADIFLMSHLNHFSAVLTNLGEYLLEGELWTLAGDVACRISVLIKDGVLSAVADTAKGVMTVDGGLIEERRDADR